MKKIGIVGRGFVGSAVEFGFSAQTGCNAIVKVYDKDSNKTLHSLDDTINNSDYINNLIIPLLLLRRNLRQF